MDSIQEEKEKKLGRLARITKRLDDLEIAEKMKETEKVSKKVKKPMSLIPGKQRRIIKKSLKSKEILLFYIDMKGKLSWKLVPIFAGDVIVLNDKTHRIEPQHLMRFGKYAAYLVKETDKRIFPVSNANYNEIVEHQNSTSTHPTLIKALLSATTEMKQKKPVNWILLAIIGAAIVVGIILFA